jgi:nucleotide-binding universal stress UspA family protein
MIALKKILVATDFSEPSEAALTYGRELARQFDATLLVVHVVDNLLTRAVGGDGFAFGDPAFQKEIEDTALKQTEALLNDEDRALLRANTVMIVSNTPADAIADYARQAKVELIVMGTHGRRAIAHFFMGSVAERVVRIAPCPVLTVRQPEHELVRPDALVAVVKG